MTALKGAVAVVVLTGVRATRTCFFLTPAISRVTKWAQQQRHMIVLRRLDLKLTCRCSYRRSFAPSGEGRRNLEHQPKTTARHSHVIRDQFFTRPSSSVT